MSNARLTRVITFAPCLGLLAGCGSLLGISDLPGLDGGVGSDGPSESGVTEGGAAEGGGEAGAIGSETGSVNDAGTSNGETGPAEAGGVDAQIADGSDTGPVDSSMLEVEVPDSLIGVCTLGATQCTGDTQVQTCAVDGQWGPATACRYACVGYAGGNCGGACVPNTVQCAGTSGVETCTSAGQWQPTTTCTGGQTCQGGGSCACPSGETNCSGTCVDLSSGTPGVGGLGPTNCGTCVTQCAVGASCSGGHCL